MAYRDIDFWYSRVFREVVAGVDRESDLPVPWFTHNIWRDLQWTAHVGPCQENNECLGFGLNLENTPTWRVVRPRVETREFRDILSSLDNIEWRWHGRPVQKMRNPPFDGGGPYLVAPARNISVEEWLLELQAILDGTRRWQGGNLDGGLIRPHLQLMRRLGPASTEHSPDTIAGRMRATMAALQPVVSLLSGGRR